MLRIQKLGLEINPNGSVRLPYEFYRVGKKEGNCLNQGLSGLIRKEQNK